MFHTCIIGIYFPKDIRTVIDNIKRIFVFSGKITKLYLNKKKTYIFVSFFVYQVYIQYLRMK